jgi:hypothetical protein
MRGCYFGNCYFNNTIFVVRIAPFDSTVQSKRLSSPVPRAAPRYLTRTIFLASARAHPQGDRNTRRCSRLVANFHDTVFEKKVWGRQLDQ